MKPTIYLAGSIRDGVAEDIEWRERAVVKLEDVARLLNPLAGKQFDAATGHWSMYSGTNPDSKYIVQADFWSVDRSDIIIFDFRSLIAKYPSIGTLVEFGRSTIRSIMRFAIIPEEYKGHNNLQHFAGLHPFLAENCAQIFHGPDAAVDFTRNYCIATTQNARYGNHA